MHLNRIANDEQGMMNEEVKNNNFIIKNSTFNIQISINNGENNNVPKSQIQFRRKTYKFFS